MWNRGMHVPEQVSLFMCHMVGLQNTENLDFLLKTLYWHIPGCKQVWKPPPNKFSRDFNLIWRRGSL
jgi:hypothetical protein